MFGMIGINPKTKKASAAAPTWPTGTDGDLIINGTTFTLDSSSGPISKNYNNITIINSGILSLIGSNWFSIGYAGTLTMDSTAVINCHQNGDNIANNSTNTYTAIAPDGTSLSAGTLQSFGGTGGLAPFGA